MAAADGNGGSGHSGWEQIDESMSFWRKGPWTAEEDQLLINYVRLHGEGRWSSVARLAGLNRNGKSCRLRWVNYLRPDLKRGQITPYEESVILELHARWGNRWSTIARSLPGRTDNEIKNYWRTHFKKRPKLSTSNNDVKPKSRLLKKQQFHQQQQAQQVQQQQMNQMFDMKKMMFLLEEYDPELPLYDQPQTRPEITPDHEQSYLFNLLNSFSYGDMSVPGVTSTFEETTNDDDIIWDNGLWSLEEEVNNGIIPRQRTVGYDPSYFRACLDSPKLKAVNGKLVSQLQQQNSFLEKDQNIADIRSLPLLKLLQNHRIDNKLVLEQ
ncbi:hypothetical protein ACFE04_012779 [Oxalis oulophora]